jgi:tRNA A-37 threonylcarbamoyl transferase component Bud32
VTGIPLLGSSWGNAGRPVGSRQGSAPPSPTSGVVMPPILAALADRYEVVRELGAGAAATVHLARDVKYDRLVALKVARPELSGAVEADRFRREITVAARLQHPHVLSVYDSGVTEGVLWYTMPDVEGESLRDRLRREPQLPVGDAVRIAREVASALEYAHRHGVLHRDVKPGNVILASDGSAMLADFGMARVFDAAEGDVSLTRTGLTVGTPAYMSPEQASGERELDARSDVYSLDCVLYEMLAGRPPFTGPTRQAVLAKRFAGAPASIRSYRDGIPAPLDAVVGRAMGRAPADRYESAAAFGDALGAAITSGSSPAIEATPVRPRRRRALLVSGALAAFLAAVGATALWGRREPAREVLLPRVILGPIRHNPYEAAVVSRTAIVVCAGSHVLSRHVIVRRWYSPACGPRTGDPASADPNAVMAVRFEGLCPDDWAVFERHCYAKFMGFTTWNSARDWAATVAAGVGLTGYLVSINSGVENTFVYTQFGRPSMPPEDSTEESSFWMGLRDTTRRGGPNGVWVWEDGTVLDVADASKNLFHGGQADNLLDTEYHVRMLETGPVWGDGPDEYVLQYAVVEAPQSPLTVCADSWVPPQYVVERRTFSRRCGPPQRPLKWLPPAPNAMTLVRPP